MNKETIEKAAITEVMKLPFSAKHEHSRINARLSVAFVVGAEWRINSVWHDGTISCQTRRKTLVLFKNGKAAVYNDLRDLTHERLWGEVDKFAYLDDLFPDRKED